MAADDTRSLHISVQFSATNRPNQSRIVTLVLVGVGLQAKGIVFEKLPAYNPDYNIRHCFLRDPNGYLIEIQTFLDPAWSAPAEQG